MIVVHRPSSVRDQALTDPGRANLRLKKFAPAKALAGPPPSLNLDPPKFSVAENDFDLSKLLPRQKWRLS